MKWDGFLRNPPGVGYSSFSSWKELKDYVDDGKTVYYQAPLDRYPVRVRAHTTSHKRTAKIRVTPLSLDADPFTADSGHLSRFRKA